MQKPAMLAGKQQTVRSKGDNVMCTLRTLTTIGLVLVLAAGASAADKKGRSGNSHKVAPKSGSREIRGDRDVKPLKVGVAPQPGSPAAVSKLRWQSLPLGVAPKPGSPATISSTFFPASRLGVAPKPGSSATALWGQLPPDGSGPRATAGQAQLGTGNGGTKTGPRQATDAEIIKALNNRRAGRFVLQGNQGTDAE